MLLMIESITIKNNLVMESLKQILMQNNFSPRGTPNYPTLMGQQFMLRDKMDR